MTATTRRTTRLRPIHFVLSLLLAFVGVVAIGGPAHAVVDTISGTVTTPANTANISVYLSQDLGGSGPAFDGTFPVELTDGSGYFEFTSVPNGDYLLVVDAGDDWVQYWNFVSIDGVIDQTPLLIDLEPGVLISGTARDAEAPFTTLAGISVSAFGNNSFFPYLDWRTLDLDASNYFGAPTPVTDGTGMYAFVVPLDDSYEVSAFDVNELYGDQSWNHRNGYGCGCAFDPVVIPDVTGLPYGPVTGIDFDLLAYANWIYFSVYTDDLNGVDKPGVLIHLDKWNGATWDLDVDTEVTDADGLADVFGLGDGDYRLRYSVSGVFKAIDSWYEPSYGTWPLFDSGFSVELPGLTAGCGCGGFTTLYPDLTFPLPASGGGGGGGGTTPGTPRRPSGSSGATFATPTPTPTPSATPTSSPSPSSSPSGEPSASPEPTDEPEPTSNPFDLWWLWLLLLLILALIVFFLVRLIRGRA